MLRLKRQKKDLKLVRFLGKSKKVILKKQVLYALCTFIMILGLLSNHYNVMASILGEERYLLYCIHNMKESTFDYQLTVKNEDEDDVFIELYGTVSNEKCIVNVVSGMITVIQFSYEFESGEIVTNNSEFTDQLLIPLESFRPYLMEVVEQIQHEMAQLEVKEVKRHQVTKGIITDYYHLDNDMHINVDYNGFVRFVEYSLIVDHKTYTIHLNCLP